MLAYNPPSQAEITTEPSGLYVHVDGYEHPIFLPDEAILQKRQVLPLVGCKTSKWWAGIKSGEFPPGRLWGKTRVWTVGEIRLFLQTVSAKGGSNVAS